ncbi:secretoglobin family 1D member 2-like [Artibeus jamaicensis]|uniref:secretoglobin family 1D member 2-like n=1 Tax=Artibeus jamaicensis TaxID=9417 RepID=UPI00235A88CD|nr:secretoglobin family 1D member 2-like [Artibeus jamaicensis]
MGIVPAMLTTDQVIGDVTMMLLSPAANCSLCAKAELKATSTMRLSLCVLLVTLALCCYEANARICPAYISEHRSLLLDSAKLYNINLLRFFPAREDLEAMMNVKQCIDLMPFQDRKKIDNVLKTVESKCNN